ncbi:MAG: excinuclease subunit [Patescibacteria group bacterium]|jgi:excinuclease UvrABC nuclease subunit|nr:excinuclease subunit [Patescibacteria group bacterium]MDQ5961684.1 excinuclease subunit [Patescibacteria group bacterium]
MKLSEVKKLALPEKPGVYFFRKGKDILYIGKATSLRDRTRSYFAKDLIDTRGPAILDMTVKTDTLDWKETDSVLEALLLEAELIKKYQPHYNVKEKSDKSFMCVGITDEVFPQVLSIRKKDIDFETNTGKNFKLKAIYGPFANGSALREALKIIRRIFPFRDDSSSKSDNYEFYKQIELTPDMSESDAALRYGKTVKNIRLFFEGKKKDIVRNLKKEMMECAKKQQFEEAHKIKKTLFSLEHINDVALIKKDYSGILQNYRIDGSGVGFRIEAYDVAHMSGKNMVGVMTVLENGIPAKKEYKKFIVRTQTNSNDTGALEEILSRRFRHMEWGIPDLIVVDGSVAQENIAKQVLDRYQISIPVVAVVKDERHKAREIRGDKTIVSKYKDAILLVNSEAHRFAITFHKLKRSKNFLGKK